MKKNLSRSEAVTNPLPKFTFPKSVLQPQPSQLELSKDSVADEVRQLNLRAQHLGSKLGVTMRDFDIGEFIQAKKDAQQLPSNERMLGMLALSFSESLNGRETLSLEPRGNVWSIFYHRGAGTTNRQPLSVPLVDAPLPVRIRFCHVSFEFFDAYLKAAGKTLGETKDAAESARRTLAALDQIEPE